MNNLLQDLGLESSNAGSFDGTITTLNDAYETLAMSMVTNSMINNDIVSYIKDLDYIQDGINQYSKLPDDLKDRASNLIISRISTYLDEALTLESINSSSEDELKRLAMLARESILGKLKDNIVRFKNKIVDSGKSNRKLMVDLENRLLKKKGEVSNIDFGKERKDINFGKSAVMTVSGEVVSNAELNTAYSKYETIATIHKDVAETVVKDGVKLVELAMKDTKAASEVIDKEQTKKEVNKMMTSLFSKYKKLGVVDESNMNYDKLDKLISGNLGVRPDKGKTYAVTVAGKDLPGFSGVVLVNSDDYELIMMSYNRIDSDKVKSTVVMSAPTREELEARIDICIANIRAISELNNNHVIEAKLGTIYDQLDTLVGNLESYTGSYGTILAFLYCVYTLDSTTNADIRKMADATVYLVDKMK